MAMSLASRLLRGALLLAGAAAAAVCGATTAVGQASAKVLPSTLSASVALYTRTAPIRSCGADCTAAPLAERSASVSMGSDGVAQFTMFGDTTSNYIVRFSGAGWGARPGDVPIVLEPTLTGGGGVSIVIALAPATTDSDAFQVVINYN